MNEIWKDILGYEGLYQVSNLGRVKSLDCKNTKIEKILNLHKEKTCYLRICLYKEGKRKSFLVHRLVAQAFIPNPLNLPCVNHKDENKENNCIENLEWCDAKYNYNYGTAIKRQSKMLINNKKLSKKVLCIETETIFPSTREAERQTGIANQNISACCLNKPKYKTAGGFHWRFYD